MARADPAYGAWYDQYLAAPTYEARLTLWEGYLSEADPHAVRQARSAVQQVLAARSGQAVV